MLYEDDGIRVIQKYGRDVVLLSSVYGDEVIKLSALYGDDVISYVSKYGSSGVRSIVTYGNDVIRLAKSTEMMSSGMLAGMETMDLRWLKRKDGAFCYAFYAPKIFTKAAKFTRYGLSAALLIAFVTHPLAFLSGLVKALAWLSGINPVIIAIIMGLLATFLLIRLLRKFLGIFHPMIVCLRALKNGTGSVVKLTKTSLVIQDPAGLKFQIFSAYHADCRYTDLQELSSVVVGYDNGHQRHGF